MSHTDIFCCFLPVYHHNKPNFSHIILAYVQNIKINTKKHYKIMSPSKASVCDISDILEFFWMWFGNLQFRHSISHNIHVGMFVYTKTSLFKLIWRRKHVFTENVSVWHKTVFMLSWGCFRDYVAGKALKRCVEPNSP